MREKEYKTGQLENTLDNVAQAMARYIEKRNLDKTKLYNELNDIQFVIPDSSIRVTVIDQQGIVLYDSFVDSFTDMENHLERPEVQKAKDNGRGSNIRRSNTTSQEFYYYARKYETYYIRCAMVYDMQLEHFLKASRIFVIFMIMMFVVMFILLHVVTKQLSEFITKLRDFAVKAGDGEEISANIKFSDSEFEDIQHQIISIYNQLKHAKDDLSAEKERLFNHLHALNEGIAFFSPQKEKLLANSHFVQYTNLISERSSISVESIFDTKEMSELLHQLESYICSEEPINPRKLPQAQITVTKSEYFFRILGIVFPDRSFEILIEDITRLEKRRLLKQQLTSNIAHELKTPLASVKGYLETLMSNPNVAQDKMQHFIARAFTQTERLNELLNDISLINNIEDAADLFEMKKVRLLPLINEVVENFGNRIQDNNINLSIKVSEDVCVYGNDSLLSSIFQNFLENTINYAGKGVSAEIKQYTEDDMNYYFSFSNTGKPIPEEHLSRIFERFYRIDEGRTRDIGGTGLGLSIVKNAIKLHKGEISVRNNAKAGVVFLFSLAKN